MKKDEHGFEAVPAVIVADKRDTLGKRIGFIGVGLLILFFLISSYIQSSKNGAELKKARADNSNLSQTLDRVSRTLDQQIIFTQQLQAALREQNMMLRKLGVPTVPIPLAPQLQPENGTTPGVAPPGSTYEPVPQATAPRQNNPQPRPSSSPKPQPRPTSSPKPRPRPTPSPTPLLPVGGTVCQLTGICLTP